MWPKNCCQFEREHKTKLNKWSFFPFVVFSKSSISGLFLYSEIQFSALLVTIYNSFSVIFFPSWIAVGSQSECTVHKQCTKPHPTFRCLASGYVSSRIFSHWRKFISIFLSLKKNVTGKEIQFWAGGFWHDFTDESNLWNQTEWKRNMYRDE